MSRTDIEQTDVIEAVADRLRAALELPASRCFPVARPMDVPAIPPGGDYFLTVAPGGGTFEEEEQMPGTAASGETEAVAGNVTEYASFIVSGYTRIKTDRTSTDKYLLLNDARGLFSIKKKILTALCGQDLTDGDGDTFLRQLIHATQAEPPDVVSLGADNLPCGRIAVTFGVIFDWSLI